MNHRILGLTVGCVGAFCFGVEFCGAQSSSSPTIEKLSPRVAKVGATSQDVVISGAGFMCSPQPSVYFNGSKLNPIGCNNRSISITLTATELAMAGKFPIIVQNDGSTASMAKLFEVSETGFEGVDLVLGIGALLTGEDTSYKINSTGNVLEGTVIGRATPQLLAGVAFALPWWPRYTTRGEGQRIDRLHAFVSLKFAPSSSQTLNGFAFGISYRLSRYLSALVGLTLTPFDEPSPGFKAAAINAVQMNPGAYAGFSATTLAASSDNPSAFDGFPLLRQPLPAGSSPTTNANLYPGDPLETHYRPGILIGISIPFSLDSLFRRPQDTRSAGTGSGNAAKQP